MFEWFTKKQDAKRFESVKEMPKFTKADVTPEIYNELESEFYRDFQFVKLYTPSMEEGIFGKIVPYITFAISIITMLVVIIKK